MESYNNDISKIDNLELVQISVDRNLKQAVDWAKKEKFTWPTVLIENRAAGFLSGIKTNAVPTYVLVDKEGKEIMRGHGSGPIIAKAKELAGGA